MKVRDGAVFTILVVYLLIFPASVSASLVAITWNNNMESDLAGYRVYCGTMPGGYDYVLDARYNNQVYVSGLEEGIPYYFAVTAYDWSGNESDFSEEVLTVIPYGQRPVLDILLELGLTVYDVLYEFSTYVPGSSILLESSLFGIYVDIPSGAISETLPLGIGSGGDDWSPFSSQLGVPTHYLEFDIVPAELVLLEPALVSFPFEADRVGVERYDERTGSWVWVSDVQSSGGLVSFSTQQLGRFKVYELSANPGNDAAEGSSSGGGGGCFVMGSRGGGVGSSLPGFVLLAAVMGCLLRAGFERRASRNR